MKSAKNKKKQKATTKKPKTKISTSDEQPPYAHTRVIQTIHDFFQSTTPREKLLLWMLWELQGVTGISKLDIANEIMEDISEDLNVGDDKELNCLKGICQGLELMNAYS